MPGLRAGSPPAAHRTRTLSCYSTLRLLPHIGGSFLKKKKNSPVCFFHFSLSSNPWFWRHLQSLLWSVHQPIWIHLWFLRHWSEPIKSMENGLLNPNALAQCLRATCNSASASNRNNNNYHLLNQKLHTINYSKCFSSIYPLATLSMVPETAEISDPTWDLMNENLHYFINTTPS